MKNYKTQNYICSLKVYIKSRLMAFERIELFQVPQCFYQLKCFLSLALQLLPPSN